MAASCGEGDWRPYVPLTTKCGSGGVLHVVALGNTGAVNSLTVNKFLYYTVILTIKKPHHRSAYWGEIPSRPSDLLLI